MSHTSKLLSTNTDNQDNRDNYHSINMEIAQKNQNKIKNMFKWLEALIIYLPMICNKEQGTKRWIHGVSSVLGILCVISFEIIHQINLYNPWATNWVARLFEIAAFCVLLTTRIISWYALTNNKINPFPWNNMFEYLRHKKVCKSRTRIKIKELADEKQNEYNVNSTTNSDSFRKRLSIGSRYADIDENDHSNEIQITFTSVTSVKKTKKNNRSKKHQIENEFREMLKYKNYRIQISMVLIGLIYCSVSIWMGTKRMQWYTFLIYAFGVYSTLLPTIITMWCISINAIKYQIFLKSILNQITKTNKVDLIDFLCIKNKYIQIEKTMKQYKWTNIYLVCYATLSLMLFWFIVENISTYIVDVYRPLLSVIVISLLSLSIVYPLGECMHQASRMNKLFHEVHKKLSHNGQKNAFNDMDSKQCRNYMYLLNYLPNNQITIKICSFEVTLWN
eukprot:124113_1